MDDPLRTCVKCLSRKPTTEFNKNRGMRDGYLRACKACNGIYFRSYRAKNADSIAEQERKRNSLPERRVTKIKQMRVFRARHPLATAAHSAVSRAIRAAVLDKLPCYFCSAAEVDAHHHDYSAPLDVTWLCKACHRKFHSLERRSTYRVEEKPA